MLLVGAARAAYVAQQYRIGAWRHMHRMHNARAAAARPQEHGDHATSYCFTSSCTTTAVAAHMPQIVYVNCENAPTNSDKVLANSIAEELVPILLMTASKEAPSTSATCHRTYGTCLRKLSQRVVDCSNRNGAHAHTWLRQTHACTQRGAFLCTRIVQERADPHVAKSSAQMFCSSSCVQGPVDFSLIVAATPAAHSVAQTSAAAAPAVESTTPIRLLHFVRDVRRLAISGFLYHSQAEQTVYCSNASMPNTLLVKGGSHRYLAGHATYNMLAELHLLAVTNVSMSVTYRPRALHY
eukprot:6213763-Pleurochrysis_carterae.AAC.2